MSSIQMSPQGSGIGMDHDISNSHRGGTSTSSLDEEPLCTQVVDYSAIDMLHAWRGWSSRQGRGGGRQECHRGGLHPNGEEREGWYARGGLDWRG